MREIDPKDVPQLMRDGKLWFGMELEFFSSHIQQWTDPMKFIGFDPSPNISPRHVFCGGNGGWYSIARFPLPKLRDGDPVVVSYSDKTDPCRRIFKEFDEHGDYVTWSEGCNRWTSLDDESIWWGCGRPATFLELSNSGYTKDQINEMMTRWGTVDV